MSSANAGLDDLLKELREQAKSGTDILAAARAPARIYVELVARDLALWQRIDVIALNLAQPGLTSRERLRILSDILRNANIVTQSIPRNIDGYISCFGGIEAIVAQTRTAQTDLPHANAAGTDVASSEREQNVKNLIQAIANHAKQGHSAARPS